ncbi:MAG: permease [Bacteroidota bacterium]
MEKTLGLLLMISLGLLLQRKIRSSDQLAGLKVLILSLALPATIFVALLNVELSENMLLFPVLALAINGLLLGATSLGNRLFPQLDQSRRRTLMMLIPSLAPGLSCFPFLAEYLGDESVALAALADVGNKLFVLLLLYLLAMHWYYKFNSQKGEANKGKLKQLVMALLGEPINMVMIVALVMLAFGLNLQSLPETASNVILRLSSIMAPLILLFIGLAVKINKTDFALILQLLSWRSGLVFLISAGVIAVVPDLSVPMMLLAIVFPQSSCSFWPFAHMSSVNAMEEGSTKTFDINFALSVLAISLPFSTIVILGVFSFQTIVINPIYLSAIGVLLIVLAFIPQLIARFKTPQVSMSVDSAQLETQTQEVVVPKALAEAS